MKKRLLIFVPLVMFIILLNLNWLYADSEIIPSWIKKIAKFWSDGTTTDAEFVNALQYLIDKKIISIQDNVIAPHIVIMTDKQQYKIGEPIVITVSNMGSKEALFGSRPFIGISSVIDKKPVCCLAKQVETYLHPNQSTQYTWNQIEVDSGTQVKPYQYIIHVTYSIPDDANQNDYETRKLIEIIN